MRRDSRGVTPRDTVPGLIKVPGKNELRPNARDRRGGEGPLAFVPAGSQQVQNFGGSSASARTVRSIPTKVPKKKADETPNITPGYDRVGSRHDHIMRGR